MNFPTKILIVLGTFFACQISIAQSTFHPIETGYAGASGINAVSFRRNGIHTVGNQQFVAYYNDDRRVTIARRTLGEGAWEIFTTALVDPNSNATDGHNVITFGIDGNGIMHMCWGMHNHDLLYVQSTTPVTGDTQIAFTGLMSMTGINETIVTYPEFYPLENGDLLFLFRRGFSGNGDTHLKRYISTTESWADIQLPLYDGRDIGLGFEDNCAYFHRLGFDNDGNLLASWTIRNTPNYQTNHNLFFAKSPDYGVSWTDIQGNELSLPLDEGSMSPIVDIPTGFSLINQADMTVDTNGNPIIATWWAPGTASGNFNRQYMLVWHDGTQWRTSQITNRTSDSSEQGGGAARDLARPIVVSDSDGKVYVALRFRERGDVLTIAVSSSPDRDDWQFIDLPTGSLGNYEPVFDTVRWQRDGILSFLLQSIIGESTQIRVLDWVPQEPGDEPIVNFNYFDDFDGNSNPLNGAVEDGSGAIWIANNFVNSDGSFNGGNEGSALLPFDPVVDQVYHLSMDVFNMSDRWVALGFCRDIISSPGQSSFADRFSNDADGIAWMLYRNTTAADQDIQIFEGLNTAGNIYSEDYAGGFSVPRTLSITIDTTGDGASFQAEFRIEQDTLYSGTVNRSVNEINYVGFSFDDSTNQTVFVDNFSLTQEAELLLGDVNCDGDINLLDVAPFVDLISNGTFSEKADMNQDGTVNLLDVEPFINQLSGG